MRLSMLLALLVCAVAGDSLADDLVMAPGSAIGLVLPSDFVPSREFGGFESRERDMTITVTELPPETYDEIAAGLAEDFARQGVTLTRREDFPVDGRPGVLATGTVGGKGYERREWKLVFSGRKLTGVVTVITGTSGPGLDSEVRPILASIRAVAVTPTERAATLPFTLQETERFQIYRTLGWNGVIFIPRLRNASAPDAAFFVELSAGDHLVLDQRSYARDAAESLYGVENVEIQAVDRRQIGGVDGVELTATATDARTGAPLRIAQWITFAPDGRSIRMVGIAPEASFAELLPEFEALRDGISFKDG